MTDKERKEYRKRAMIDGTVYSIAANSALNTEDIEKIITDLQLLVHTRNNIPF